MEQKTVLSGVAFLGFVSVGGVSQGPQLAPGNGFRELERIPPQQIDVAETQGREPGQILCFDAHAAGLQVGDGGVEVPGVPEDDGIDDESERPN